MLTDFDIKTQEDSAQIVSQKQGQFEFRFDKLVAGEINGGGQLLTIETNKGDIRLRKHKFEPAGSIQNLMETLIPSRDPADSSKIGVGEMEKRQKTYQDIRAFVESDQMPEYLMHAAHAGLLELKREQAIRQLQIKKAYKIEAELLLDYEKAIQSYEAMMANASWRERFPAMDLNDTAPYRRRLEFLKAEFSKRVNSDPIESEYGDFDNQKKPRLKRVRLGWGPGWFANGTRNWGLNSAKN